MRRRNAWIALLTAVVALALAAPGMAVKKPGKGKKKSGPVNITKTVNLGIPDRGPGMAAPWGALDSTITVGKAFKGKRVRDVNVTLQTTGAVADANEDVLAQLTAPNNATLLLFFGLSGQSIGPLTLDDEALGSLISGPPPCAISTWLCEPYVGRARAGMFPFEQSLFLFDDAPVRGTWTLRLFDAATTKTSTLNSWTLNVTTGKPFKTK